MTETELLTLAAALEGRSEHPLARAVLAYAEEKQLELPSVTDFTALPGNGLTAKLEGKEIFGGNAAFIGTKVSIPAALQTQAAALAAQGKTPCSLAAQVVCWAYRGSRYHQGGQPAGHPGAAKYGYPGCDADRR